jgi:hypothetical protein
MIHDFGSAHSTNTVALPTKPVDFQLISTRLWRLRSVKPDLCRLSRHVKIPVDLAVHGVVFALDEESVLAHLLGHNLVESLGFGVSALDAST